ncbi:MAG TPA: RNA ligase [Ktedonobacteraceae bacterium]|nr:RNA ligase [Ktedonobacteraceae bacterium]
MATIDIDQFRQYEKQGLITCRNHPEFDLLIWNYTAKCQFERVWDQVTMQARGLITKSDGTIVGRGFKKFFNIEEHQGSIPLEAFKVTEKLDGSLGILFQVNGIAYIATRGSFTSEQAVKGTEILHRKYRDFPFQEQYTYLFEIVYPENSIVVDYGEREDLILLAVIHTKTGTEDHIHQINDWPFPVVKYY